MLVDTDSQVGRQAASTNTLTHTYTHALTHARAHARRRSYTHALTHIRTHLCNIQTLARAYTYNRPHTHTHTRTHAGTRTHARTRANLRALFPRVFFSFSQPSRCEDATEEKGLGGLRGKVTKESLHAIQIL